MHINRHLATLYILIIGCFVPAILSAQRTQPRSIRQAQSDIYRAYGLEREEQWDSLNGYRGSFSRMPMVKNHAIAENAAACRLDRIVFGWSPYWVGTAYTSYDYSLLSDVCYFSYEVDPATGSYRDIHSWKTTDLVTRAKAAGTRVHLCVTLFSDHASLLEQPQRRRTLIDSLIALVRLRSANGVNIDFEGVPSGQRGNLTTFMTELGSRFHTELPGSMISIALPSVDWGNAFDVAAMIPYVDLFIIMGYDYYWRSSSVAGPVAPKNNGQLWSPYDATRSINRYLGLGIPEAKLSLGVPYYGYDWPTVDSTIGAATTGAGVAVLYSSARRNAEIYGRIWEPQSSTPFYRYNVGGIWHQAWYEDAESLGMKYDLVRARRLAGIGIWALSYDGEYRDLWNTIEQKFTDCAVTPCSGTLTDMGGAAGNYYDNENYTITIAPNNASAVTLSFYSFDVANDYLAIYNGRDTLAPLIGVFTGTNTPGTVNAASGAMTLKFISGPSTTSWGWRATWSCTSQPLGVGTTDESNRGLHISAHPNPYTAATAIEYFLPRTSSVEISVTDMRGKRMLLVADESQSQGYHRFEPEGLMNVPSGSYIVQIKAGRETARTIILKKD